MMLFIFIFIFSFYYLPIYEFIQKYYLYFSLLFFNLYIITGRLNNKGRVYNITTACAIFFDKFNYKQMVYDSFNF